MAAVHRCHPAYGDMPLSGLTLNIMGLFTALKHCLAAKTFAKTQRK
jgi:hypothetical protein